MYGGSTEQDYKISGILCKDIDSYYIFTISGMFDTIECKEINVPKDIQATLLNRDSSI